MASDPPKQNGKEFAAELGLEGVGTVAAEGCFGCLGSITFMVLAATSLGLLMTL